MTLAEYEKKIGDVSTRAVAKGGEELLDKVTARLAVATRHLDRVRLGVLELVPAVEKEIDESFAWAEQAIELQS